jgi:hypothetical protein
MRKTIPDGGFIFRLKKPEDQSLLRVAATLVEIDAGREVSHAEFIVSLMKKYVADRDPLGGQVNKEIQ